MSAPCPKKHSWIEPGLECRQRAQNKRALFAKIKPRIVPLRFEEINIRNLDQPASIVILYENSVETCRWAAWLESVNCRCEPFR